jgi:hypothetical protein
MRNPNMTRRATLALGAGTATTALALLTAPKAKAEADISKASVGYQDVPNNGQVCAQCVYFIFKPAEGTTPQSQCKMVAGNINPAGWCEIWAPKA